MKPGAKKVLLLVVIGIVGAGIAVGASTVLFSSSSGQRDPVTEPRGLVQDSTQSDAPDEPSPTPKATKSPKPEANGGAPSGIATGGTAADAPPATPARTSAGSTTNQKNGLVVDGGLTDGPCDDEDSEAEREQCEDELEAEADEEEAEQEEDEDKDEDEDDGPND